MSNCGLYKNKMLCTNVCPFPWTTLFVNYNGDISFCCYQPSFANIRDVSENAMDAIWNGKMAQDLRKRWIEGRLEGTPCEKCVGLRRFKYEHSAKDIPNLFDKANNPFFANAKLNLDEFNERKIILKSMPVEIVYIPNVLCNLHCIHCFQPPPGKNNTYIKSGVLSKFYNHLGSKAVKNVFSGGESFFIPQTYQLLDEFSPNHKVVSEAIFQTNGLLIKNKFQSIRGFRKYGFRISIAAFEKERYEYIHRGASFEKLIDNLEFLANRKSAGDNITMELMMILMKSNFIDLKKVFDFAETYNFDQIRIRPVHGAYGKNKVLFSENIFRFPHLLEKIPSWKEILETAVQKAKMTGNEFTYRHLEYIKSRLSPSIIVNRYRSIRNSFLSMLLKAIQYPPFFLVKKIARLALRVKIFKKLYNKIF